MHTALRHTTLCLSLLSLMLTAACQQQEASLPETAGKGRIVLAFSDAEAYVSVQTRANYPLENISDYDFTLSGTTAEGASVAEQAVTVSEGIAVFDAGTYTLHVRGNSTLEAASVSSFGTPYYEGSSVDDDGHATSFTIAPGGFTAVKVHLKPANAKLTITLDTSFTNLYKTATLTSGTRAITLLNLTDTDSQPASDTEVTAYFPAGTLSYSLSAAARATSHVTDIVAASGTLSVAAGTHVVLTLTANPVTGQIIPIVSGTHTGVFD